LKYSFSLGRGQVSVLCFFCSFGQFSIRRHFAKVEFEAKAAAMNSRPNLWTLAPFGRSLRANLPKPFSQPLPAASNPWKINRHTYLLGIVSNSFAFNHFTNSNSNKNGLLPPRKRSPAHPSHAANRPIQIGAPCD
jgi:hypothetical protein